MARESSRSPLGVIAISLIAMLLGWAALCYTLYRLARAAVPFGHDNAVEAGSMIVSFAIMLWVTVLVRRALGYPPLVTKPPQPVRETVGEALHEFATADPSPDRATLKGAGYLILFLALQVVVGGGVYFVSAVFFGLSVPGWDYGSSMPLIVAVVPAGLVIFLLERWCARLAGHGPITVMLAVAWAWISNPNT